MANQVGYGAGGGGTIIAWIKFFSFKKHFFCYKWFWLGTLIYSGNTFFSNLQYATLKPFDRQAQLEVDSSDTKRSGILFEFFTTQL